MFALDNSNAIYWTGSLYMEKCPASQKAESDSLQITVANSPGLEKHCYYWQKLGSVSK